jgi:hypothetical protein
MSEDVAAVGRALATVVGAVGLTIVPAYGAYLGYQRLIDVLDRFRAGRRGTEIDEGTELLRFDRILARARYEAYLRANPEFDPPRRLIGRRLRRYLVCRENFGFLLLWFHRSVEQFIGDGDRVSTPSEVWTKLAPLARRVDVHAYYLSHHFFESSFTPWAHHFVADPPVYLERQLKRMGSSAPAIDRLIEQASVWSHADIHPLDRFLRYVKKDALLGKLFGELGFRPWNFLDASGHVDSIWWKPNQLRFPPST